MNRTRISTTVDTGTLEQLRRLFDLPDSQLVDRALNALLSQVEAEHERRAMMAKPYDDDPDLAWSMPPGEALPYDGDVPDEVVRLARERRARYGRGG